MEIKESSIEEGCNLCPVQCQSAFARLRAKGTDTFDSIRHCTSFKNHSSIPFLEEGRQKFYCILRGNVKLSDKQGAVIRICGPGDIIGYDVTKNHDYYAATALGDVNVCAFDKELFSVIQDKSSEISNEFQLVLFKEIEQRNERINALEHHSVKSKVAAALLSLNRKFGTPSDYGTRINVPLDRKTLALLSGTVIESIARTLTELENAHVIRRIGRDIHIQDSEKLKELSMK